jgi:hypothetical protein
MPSTAPAESTKRLDRQALQRVVVVGTSGSGKTHLAQALAQRLGLAHVELDALFWQPHWQGTPREVFREKVSAALAAPAWALDGNYRSVRDLTWGRATALVWLDYPLPLVMWRLARRTFGRMARRELLWGTNHEQLGTAVFSRDSIFLWALNSPRRHRRDYPPLLASPEYAHLATQRFYHPRETERWLAGLK